ncbi:MAG: peptide ABC transporter substrate-binding protein [Chloroflexi bacterium]|nr:peptide ABC transporter substrate-binding protein [Chloroflexota bacterium]
MGKTKSCKFLSVFGTLALLIVMLISGCAPSQPTKPVSVDATQVLQPTTSQAGTEAGAGTSTITIVIPEDPPNFNPVIADSGYDALVMHMVLLGMTAIDPEGKVYPVLAAELPTSENGGVVINPDSGTMDVIWKMRTDITWADGSPVTADDVLFTYQAIIDPGTGAWIPGIDLVTGVDKIDDYQFVVHFSSVYPSYLTLFGNNQVAIWPKHYCKADQGFQSWDCGRKPLSDGPFLLDEWVTGDHLTFVRNPKYFEQGKPNLDRVIIKIVPDATVRETMMRQGDADVLMWATEQVADNLKNESNVKVSISPTSRFAMRLYLNLAAKGTTDPVASPNPFFSDVRVRQAIRSAIDVDAITATVWHGFAVPVWSELFRPPYNTCNIPRPKFDAEAAKALLEQAGWVDTDGDGIRECKGCKTARDGEKFKFDLLTYSEYGEPLTLTQQLIGEMLKNVGIQADLTQSQGSVMWADTSSGGIEQSGNFDIDLYDDGYFGNDPTDFIWKYYNSSASVPDQGWNIGRWNNPQMDDLLNQAYTLDEKVRQQAFCEMAKLLDAELPQILLFSTLNADAYSTRLSNIQANINSVVSWNSADWDLVK